MSKMSAFGWSKQGDTVELALSFEMATAAVSQVTSVVGAGGKTTVKNLTAGGTVGRRPQPGFNAITVKHTP